MKRKHSFGFTLVALLLLPTLSGCFGSSNIVNDLLDNPGIPGGLTLACLDSSQYTKLVIEIDYETDYKPEASSTDLLIERIEQVCDKPNGVEIDFNPVSYTHLTLPTIYSV